MRLSRFRHDDVQPRAQLAHGGSIPRGRQGMHGSMTTLVPTATEQFGPASTTRPGRLVAEDEGKGPDGRQGRRRPGVVREQVEVAAADPPRRDRHAGPRRARERGLGDLGQRSGELGVGHVEHHGAHRRERRRAAVGLTRETAWHKVPAMRVSDATLAEVRERGFSLLEGFLSDDELAAAREALWLHFPRPTEYFADPPAFARYAASQFAGVEEFPYRSWDLNRLAVHPDLVDAAERYLQTAELHLYKVELWAKYAGAVNYDQPLHRDYGSHSLVVPRPEPRYQQLTTFIYLSDVTEEDGPTLHRALRGRQGRALHAALPAVRVAGRRRGGLHGAGGEPARLPDRHPAPRLGDDGPRPVTLLHPGRLPGARHDLGREDGLAQAVARALGPVHPAVRRAGSATSSAFPARATRYWSEETLEGVAARYPGIDLAPYRDALG